MGNFKIGDIVAIDLSYLLDEYENYFYKVTNTTNSGFYVYCKPIYGEGESEMGWTVAQFRRDEIRIVSVLELALYG